MKTFTYRSAGGVQQTVEADRVEFTPNHVVFWRDEPEVRDLDQRHIQGGSHLVLAERSFAVSRLEQLEKGEQPS